MDRTTLVRAGMVALAVPNIVIAAWAALAPQHWYDTFPSSGSPWISPDGPFNEHLTIDAGEDSCCWGCCWSGLPSPGLLPAASR